MYALSQHFKTPMHVATEGMLGRFSISRGSINPETNLVHRVQASAAALFSAVALLVATPFWIAGEVLEICTKKGRKHFNDHVDLNGTEKCLDPNKTEMVGTGLSTFQATSDSNFCKGSSMHDAVKDPTLGLGKGVDILTREGRDQTIFYLKEMNATTFRFSVEWPDVKQHGLDKYIEAAKHFHEQGFKLVITLDHWLGDGTVDAFEKGGDEAAFVGFCEDVYKALRPYARHFLTFNEIHVDAAQKYVMGDLPPNNIGKFWAARKLAALKLQAHATVYDALHALEKSNPNKEGELKVGLSHQAIMMRSNSRWNVVARVAAYVMTYLFHGSFMKQVRGVREKLDFLGVQYYTRPLLGRKGVNPCDSIAEQNVHNPNAWMVEGMRYRFDPQGILPILQSIHQRINSAAGKEIPFIVTEIGSAGKISVEERFEADSNENRKAIYNQIALQAMRKAQDLGVPLIGALFCTLFDNLEWQRGYKPGTAFGIVAREGREVRATRGFHVLKNAFNRIKAQMLQHAS